MIEVGFRNGRLVTVEKQTEKSDDGHARWLCFCDCGKQKVVSSNMLRTAGVRSCGCLRAEAQQARVKRDGVWNDQKSYAIKNGEHCYRTRHSWSKAVIKHYGNKCERCGWSEARCDAHHRIPKAKGGLHTIANGIVLCPNHHRIEHESGNVD